MPQIEKENFESQRKFLSEYGYLHVKNFFSDEQIKLLRDFLDNKKKLNDDNEVHDILAVDEINHVFLNDKFLNLATNLFGENVYYFGASTMRYHQNDVDEFHIDSRKDSELNYQNEYPIYRIAIYLQNHDNWSGGIKLREKSHKKICVRLSSLRRIKDTMRKLLKNKRNFLDLFFQGKIKNIRSKQNDLIIWNMRTHHSGRFKLLNLIPSLSLHPILEKFLPDFLFKKYEKDRYASFIAFGRDESKLLDFFIEDYRSQRNKEIFKNFFENKAKYEDILKKYSIKVK